MTYNSSGKLSLCIKNLLPRLGTEQEQSSPKWLLGIRAS